MSDNSKFLLGIVFFITGFVIMIVSFNLNVPNMIVQAKLSLPPTEYYIQLLVKSLAFLLTGFLISLGGMLIVVNEIKRK